MSRPATFFPAAGAAPTTVDGARPLPRVLLLSQVVPQTVYAGSIILYRLFERYPPEKLLVLGPPPEPTAKTLSCKYRPIGIHATRLEWSRFSKIPRTLDLYGIRRLKSQSVLRDLQFEPQVVVTVMQSFVYYRAASEYARKYGLPLILIVHDLPEQFESVYNWARRHQTDLNAQIYRHAERRLCVSPEMAERLHSVFGAPGEVLYPLPSRTELRSLDASAHLRHKAHLTIGYAGALGYGYGQALAALIPAFERTGSYLRIYSQSQLAIASPAVTNCSAAESPQATWSCVQNECDAVILPYDFNSHRDLYSTHFPSKLPEYLQLGMPILAVGPSYATGIRWAQQHPDAILVVTDDSESAAEEALRRLTEAELRIKMATEASRLRSEFDPEKIISTFYDVLTEVALGSVRQN